MEGTERVFSLLHFELILNWIEFDFFLFVVSRDFSFHERRRIESWKGFCWLMFGEEKEKKKKNAFVVFDCKCCDIELPRCEIKALVVAVGEGKDGGVKDFWSFSLFFFFCFFSFFFSFVFVLCWFLWHWTHFSGVDQSPRGGSGSDGGEGWRGGVEDCEGFSFFLLISVLLFFEREKERMRCWFLFHWNRSVVPQKALVVGEEERVGGGKIVKVWEEGKWENSSFCSFSFSFSFSFSLLFLFSFCVDFSDIELESKPSWWRGGGEGWRWRIAFLFLFLFLFSFFFFSFSFLFFLKRRRGCSF